MQGLNQVRNQEICYFISLDTLVSISLDILLYFWLLCVYSVVSEKSISM